MPTILVKSGDEYPMYFNRQLERTGAEYFDYYLMHNMGKDRYAKATEFGGFEFAEEMKKKEKSENLDFHFTMMLKLLTESLQNTLMSILYNFRLIILTGITK